MLNSVFLHTLMFIIHLCLILYSVEVVLLLLWQPLCSIVSHCIPNTVSHCQTLNNYVSILMGGSHVSAH